MLMFRPFSWFGLYFYLFLPMNEDGKKDDCFVIGGKEQVLYRDNMMTENDYRNCIDFAREEGHASGFAEGIAEGEARGLAVGEAKGIVTVAKSMKAMNLPTETIMQATGLALSEIEAL